MSTNPKSALPTLELGLADLVGGPRSGAPKTIDELLPQIHELARAAGALDAADRMAAPDDMPDAEIERMADALVARARRLGQRLEKRRPPTAHAAPSDPTVDRATTDEADSDRAFDAELSDVLKLAEEMFGATAGDEADGVGDRQPDPERQETVAKPAREPEREPESVQPAVDAAPAPEQASEPTSEPAADAPAAPDAVASAPTVDDSASPQEPAAAPEAEPKAELDADPGATDADLPSGVPVHPVSGVRVDVFAGDDPRNRPTAADNRKLNKVREALQAAWEQKKATPPAAAPRAADDEVVKRVGVYDPDPSSDRIKRAREALRAEPSTAAAEPSAPAPAPPPPSPTTEQVAETPQPTAPAAPSQDAAPTPQPDDPQEIRKALGLVAKLLLDGNDDAPLDDAHRRLLAKILVQNADDARRAGPPKDDDQDV